MQAVLNLKQTCDCVLLFNCDRALLLLSMVAHLFLNIAELGEVMEILHSLDMPAWAFSIVVFYQQKIAVAVVWLVVLLVDFEMID